MSSGGAASGTAARTTSMKRSGSTRATLSLLTSTLSYTKSVIVSQALRKLDHVLDITPDDVDTLAIKANIAQAEE